MGTKIKQAYGVGQGLINVFPPPIEAQRAPNSNDTAYPQGQEWFDNSVDPPVGYQFDGSDWTQGGNSEATTSTDGVVELATLAELQTGTAPAGAVVPFCRLLVLQRGRSWAGNDPAVVDANAASDQYQAATLSRLHLGRAQQSGPGEEPHLPAERRRGHRLLALGRRCSQPDCYR